MAKPKFRRPEPEEQHVLDHLTVRLIKPQERKRYQGLMGGASLPAHSSTGGRATLLRRDLSWPVAGPEQLV